MHLIPFLPYFLVAVNSHCLHCPSLAAAYLTSNILQTDSSIICVVELISIDVPSDFIGFRAPIEGEF